jgi:hypothetical protein
MILFTGCKLKVLNLRMLLRPLQGLKVTTLDQLFDINKKQKI